MLQGQTAHLHLVTTATSCLAVLLDGHRIKVQPCWGASRAGGGHRMLQRLSLEPEMDSSRGRSGASCRASSLSLGAASPGCAPGSTGA